MVKKGDKKRKHTEEAAPESAAPAAGGFSLFGGNKDTELDSVFSKSAAFALATPSLPVPAASSSKTTIDDPRKKAKKGKEAKGKEAKAKEVKAKESKKAEVKEDKEEAPKETKRKQPAATETEAPGAESDSDVDLTHESLKTPVERRKRDTVGAKKYVPPTETQQDRDRRTVFVGNLPLETAKAKSTLSQLKTHLLAFAPSAKIESVRFRSVAFAAPTSAPAGTEEEEGKRAKREKERAAAWKASQEGDAAGGKGNRRGDDEVTDKSKSFLDTKGKRKVAFIKKEFHSEADSCNAYVVFEHPHPDRPKNVAPILDPYQAAELAVKADGSEFMGRKIRVDHVRLPSAVALQTATNALGKRDAWLPSGTDPKKSLFVGGLDYAAKDEDVRAFFEALVVGERGQPESGGWVTSVRIVRDKDTQLGKGFGYVHFCDRESVDELIAMPSAKLKFAKKPLRVQPCKTLPPTASKPKPVAAAASSSKPAAGGKDKKEKKVRPVPTGPIPRGNPALGDKLKDLSKEERKAVKATDAERLARRAAKKQMKVANAHKETGAVKLAATKAEKVQRSKKVKAKKGRVRSAHALTKMKGQRS